MGREVRRVPANWHHPIRHKPGSYNPDGYIPLNGGSFAARLAKWEEEAAKWNEGFVKSYRDGAPWEPKRADQDYSYSEYAGDRPRAEEYMPDWAEAERTHWQMYEDTTEGTPISPVCTTPEELAHWLADNGASSFGDSTATYDQWLAMIRQGWAPSMVMEGGKGLRSGVEFASEN